MFPTRYLPKRFICSTAIEHWSSGCHNIKKIERLIYVRNIDGTFNKEGLIEHIVEVNIYYQRHRERIEIGMIRRQKWNVILGILWLAHYNLEINWRTEEVKMTRCLEKCEKQWRSKQGKSG